MMSFGYPSTFYTGTFKSEIDLAKAAGAQTSLFRMHFGTGAYFPTMNHQAFLGPVFNFGGDRVLQDVVIYRVGAAGSALYFFGSNTVDSFFLRGDLGPEFLTKSELLTTRESDFGARFLVGGGYSLSEGMMLSADYSIHLGTNADQTVTVGATLRVLSFDWRDRLYFPGAD